jgi:hypothetical protein
MKSGTTVKINKEETMYVCEENRLRNQIAMTDEELMVVMDRIGGWVYQFDLGKNDEILLRLPFMVLVQLVHLQEMAIVHNTTLADFPAIGSFKGQRGHLLGTR